MTSLSQSRSCTIFFLIIAMIQEIQLNGETWWRVAPLSAVTNIKQFGAFGFNPVIWGMSISLWTIAIWMAIDLIFQLHVTFRRWGGMYYWTVLCTSIGIGVHASMLIVKSFTVLSKSEGIGTTVVLKIGDIMNQTGFSLILYSRLNLVMRTADPRYLKFILIAIIAGSFLVNTPLLIFNFAAEASGSVTGEWLARTLIAERVLILYFTVQEAALSTLYTWTTAGLIKGTRLKQQSPKTRRNLLLFMIFAQTTTFLADVSMAGLLFADLHYKGILHPFFFGIKLKIEFMALNQLQSLVQPNVNLFTFSGEPNPAMPPVEEPQSVNGIVLEHGGEQCGGQKEQIGGSTCFAHESGKATASTPGSGGLDACATPLPMRLQVSCVESSADGSITDLERQYLGKY
jgi:hypothetical protein